MKRLNISVPSFELLIFPARSRKPTPRQWRGQSLSRGMSFAHEAESNLKLAVSMLCVWPNDYGTAGQGRVKIPERRPPKAPLRSGLRQLRKMLAGDMLLG
jgi:hypothetical protein